jgi:hypothetical protein
MLTVLYTSREVRQAIIALFSEPDTRRVAISAFVGDSAEAYLPHPSGLQLICWPKAGGTNPRTIRKLMSAGAVVLFADSLHMKVYWSEKRGAVITSANLSTNALGSGDLKEAGVSLPTGALDIDRLLASLNTRPVSEQELRRLDRLHRAFVARNGFPQRSAGNSFAEWSKMPMRPEWKLAWWEKNSERSSHSATELVKDRYDLAQPFWSFLDRRRDYKPGDWIMLFRLRKNSLSRLIWVPADEVLRVPRRDRAYDAECPYEILQIWPSKRYPPPPFRLERRFKAAFAAALRQFGTERMREHYGVHAGSTNKAAPPARFVKLLADHFNQRRASVKAQTGRGIGSNDH